ncbi:MAG: sugar nucleotidyltransferase [Planktomarina sp.]
MAAGSGSRLWPLTQAVSKQLMPVFDKPMIYYPLALLMEAGLRDIAIVVAPHDLSAFKKLLGDGGQWGISLTYIIQRTPDGIGKAPELARDFLDGSPLVLALGDNLFHSECIAQKLRQGMQSGNGATIFSVPVDDPRHFGVVTFDRNDKVSEIVEKPDTPQSDQAVTGLYIFDERATGWGEWLQPSVRGEVEITDLLGLYLKNDALAAMKLGPDTAWLDTGTQHALLSAAKLVEAYQSKYCDVMGSPDVVAFKNGWIDVARYLRVASQHQKTNYGAALGRVARTYNASMPAAARM